MGLIYFTPPLTQAAVRVRQDVGLGIAENFIIGAYGVRDGATYYGAHLLVVRPRGGWSHFFAGPSDAESMTPRLAWCYRFQNGLDSEDIWVDTETGEVIGRDGGYAGGSVKVTPPPPLAQMLKTVDRVYTLSAQPAPAKKSHAALILSSLKQAPQIAALRTATAAPQGAPAGAAPCLLVLVDNSNNLRQCAYYPKAGVLGSGADWVSVPATLRTWMQKRIAAAPTPPKK